MLPQNLPIAGPMLGAALTIVGLLVSFLVWRRRGAASGLRAVAWSLLPLAVGLLGLMDTVWTFVYAVVRALMGLMFNPMVWAGVVVTGLAVVLYVVSGIMRARGAGASATAGAKTGADAGKAPAEPGAGAPGKVGPAPTGGTGAKGAKGGGDGLSDFGDIEELLRKRGID